MTDIRSHVDRLRIDVICVGVSLVLTELIGLWTMSKVSLPSWIEAALVILLTTVVTYVTCRISIYLLHDRREVRATEIYGPLPRRRGSSPMDDVDWYDDEDDRP